MHNKRIKHKILFISSRLHPTPTANSINTYNVVEEMLNRGHDITYIAINQDDFINKETTKLIDVYNIRSTKYGKLLNFNKEGKTNFIDKFKLIIFRLSRMIRNSLQISKFPDVDPKQTKEVLFLAERLHRKKGFDCIIGVFRPFSAVSASIKMKEKFPELICGAYYLDLISGSKKPMFLPEKLYEKMCYKGEMKAFKRLDFIMMARGGKSIYSKKIYNTVNEKIRYVGFPVFKSIKTNKNYVQKIEETNLVYAGTLNKSYRNPEYAFKLLSLASKKIRCLNINLYGKGNCPGIINQYRQNEYLNIIEHGMVEHEQALQAMEQADILVNISNKTENIVPSKIFEMFATGKPIINFVSYVNDTSQNYFDEYPSVCTIKEWDNLNDNLNRLITFILSESGKQSDVSNIKKRFIENTPEYTVDILEDIINERLQ